MRCARGATIALVILGTPACAAIAGFDDFHEGCPPGMTKKASSTGLPTCVHARDAGDEGSGGSGNETGSVSGGATGGDGSAGLSTNAGGARGGSGGGTGGSAGAAGHPGVVGSGRDAAPAACVAPDPRFRGAAMARVLRPDGSALLIDRTEVTFGEYDEFRRSNPRPSTDTRCEGSAEISRDCEDLLRVPDGGKKLDPGLPRVCVDWCEAREYCLWAGKSLCADTTSTATKALLESSAFYVACKLGGSSYGCSDACRASDCNGRDAMVGHADPPGKKNQCIVGEPGCAIADLSGNVEEWTAGEDRGTPDGNCVVRGGSFDSSAEELKCTATKQIPRRAMSVALGFRCCVEPWDG
jgi:sulfatase modifying factor 1